MATSLLFSFSYSEEVYINVSVDIDNPTLIYGSSPKLYAEGQPHYPYYEDGDSVGTPRCIGTTKLSYAFVNAYPWATYTEEPNSPYCSFDPPTCDLTLASVSTTDETGVDANDGTINVFYTSSHLPITYSISGQTNNTGYFTGLEPRDYTIEVVDDLGCFTNLSVTINPFDDSLTREKYRLLFKSVKDGISYQVRFLYQKSQFDPLLYPKFLTGTDSPVIYKTTNSNEDKTAAFSPSSLEINLNANGVFEVSEFSNSQERDWKIELYRKRISDVDFTLHWQGWLLPDEIQDYYSDPDYPISLTATDGILSLKGSFFGDESNFYIDENGIKRLVPLFGQFKWLYLVKICLNQLGYDFGDATIITSLKYSNYTVAETLVNISTLADLFYDENNIAKNTYDSLEILLKGIGLCMYQYQGRFIFINSNELCYINSGTINNYIFTTDYTNVISGGKFPNTQLLGYNYPNAPINPKQTWNFDKSFSRIEGKIDFNILSLLYPNPSFELNAVQGGVPYLMVKTGDWQAFSNYDPQDPLSPTIGAYNGDWDLKTVGYTVLQKDFGGVNPLVQANSIFFEEGSELKWVHQIDDIEIDQPNKKLNISYVWKPIYYSDQENAIPRISVFYTDYNTGNTYIYSGEIEGSYNNTGWFIPDSSNPLVLGGGRITDYLAWNQFSFTTGKLPDTGIGHVAIGIGAPLSTRFAENPITEDMTIYYDNFVITQSDADDIYNFQTGEKHSVTNVTTYAKSEKKTVDLGLFTYPPNKRVSGNIFYGNDYLTSLVTNQWRFESSVEQEEDRLPANIIRRLAKTYQRPMYKFEGDISTDVASYYSSWVIKGYENRSFMAFTIDHDLRNSIAKVVIIEISDAQMQSIYQYIPVYQKSARNNLS